jgi:hypothetical protein
MSVYTHVYPVHIYMKSDDPEYAEIKVKLGGG